MVVGALLQALGPEALPYSIFVLVCILCLMLVLIECVGKKSLLAIQQQAEGGGGSVEGRMEGGSVYKGGEGQEEVGEEEASYAGTEAGHLSLASLTAPGFPYILPIGV